MFNRFDSKYSTFLTVVLIIAIVAIIGLLIFLGYDMYKKAYLTAEAGKIADQYENETKTPKVDNNTTSENTTNEADNPFGGLEGVNNSGGGSGSGSSVVKYEDYIVLGTIKIPKTGLNCPILDQETKRSLEIAVAVRYGPGVREGSPTVNEQGNTVIAGHNYRNGLFFSNNKNLNIGDTIIITSNGTPVTYVIYNKYETTTNDTDYMTREIGEKREISLTTCTDDGNNRLVIWAREQ